MSNLVFQERIKSNKLLLLITTITISLIDAFLAIIVAMGGELFSIGLPVFIIAVLDLFLLVGVCFSNFRLKCSRIYPIIYMIITLLIGVVLVPIMAKNIITMVAFVLFCIFRGVSIIALIFGVINGSNRGKGVKVLSTILTAIFLCSSVFYICNVFPKGFFGQGFIGVRNISYELDEEKDGYVATLVKGNKGDEIIVAKEFNGKKVVGIDSSIFACKDVKKVKLECDNGFFIKDESGLIDLNTNLTISTDKDNVDAFKNYLYGIAKEKDLASESSLIVNSYVAFANKITPSGLSSKQVFITFNYSLEDLKYANFEVIKTWIGKKGEIFNLAEHAGDLFYVKGYDLHDENFLKESYERDGKVISALVYNGSEIIGSPIKFSMSETVISFENIRKVFIQEDNDTIYNLYTEDAEFSKSGNARYVLESDPFNLLGDIKSRLGFTISYKYSKSLSGIKNEVTQLKDALVSDIYVYPEWILNAPTISQIQKDKSIYVYGNDLELYSTASHQAGSVFEYSWFKSTETSTVLSTENTYTKTNVKPLEDSGTYIFKVIAKPECTSLTSSATKEITINVNKKTLNFTWDKTQTTYSGTNQTIKATYESSDVINSDVIDGYITGDVANGFTATEKNAGKYQYSIVLSGDCNNLYAVDNNDLNHTWNIKPYEIEVNWQVELYTYNKNVQLPTVTTVNGIGDDSTTPLTFKVSGVSDGINAGNHKAKVLLSNLEQANNYKITNDEKEYTIAPKGITLTWSETSLTYSANEQILTANANDICSGDTCNVVVTGSGINAGNYTASATLSNKNYTIQNGFETKDYVINPKKVTLVWSATTLEYSAKDQIPTAEAEGLISEDTIKFTYTGFGKNVGDYTAVASIDNNDNYVIMGSNSQPYSITKKLVEITWSGESFTYSGKTQQPTAVAKGIYSGDTCTVNVISDGFNAGSHTASATLSNENYAILVGNETKAFTITPKTLKITAKNTNIIYGEAPTNSGVTYSGFVVDESEANLSGTLTYTYSYTQNGDIGSYQITPTGYNSSNYNIQYANGKLVVSARPLTISIEDKESIYGTTIQSLTANVTSGSIVDGDMPYSLTTEASSSKSVGNYAISGKGTDSNYDITFAKAGTYKILKATLTVTATSKTEVTYGFTGTINYQVSWETNNGQTVEVGISSVVTKTTNVGEYDITITYDSKNYELVKVNEENFKVTVNPKQVTLSWDVQEQYALADYLNVKPTVIGADLEALNLVYTYEAVTGTVENNVPTTVGDYIVSVESQNENYVLVGDLNAQFTIVE